MGVYVYEMSFKSVCLNDVNNMSIVKGDNNSYMEHCLGAGLCYIQLTRNTLVRHLASCNSVAFPTLTIHVST